MKIEEWAGSLYDEEVEKWGCRTATDEEGTREENGFGVDEATD